MEVHDITPATDMVATDAADLKHTPLTAMGVGIEKITTIKNK